MAHLPLTRIKTIMKTTDGADNVSREAIVITSRAASLFIKELTKESIKDIKRGKTLNYNNLVNIVHSQSQYNFLEQMIPKKITVQQYKQMNLKEKKEESSEDEESSSESESSSAESNSTKGEIAE